MVLDSLFNKEIRLLRKVEKLYEKGLKMMQVNNPQGKDFALDALNSVREARSVISTKKVEFSSLLSKIGALLSHYSDFKNADFAFRLAMEFNGKNVDAYIEFSLSLVKRREFDRALKMVDRAIDIDRRNQRAWETKAMIYEKIGDIDEAIKVYKTLIALYPENLDYYDRYLKYRKDDYDILYKKGMVLFKRGDLKDSIETLNKVVRLKSDHKNAYIYLGAAYMKLGKFEDAIRAFRKVIQLDPKNKAAWFNLAVTYEKLEAYDDALESIREAVKIDPNDPKVWYRRASIEMKMGAHAQALISINRALEIKRDYGDALLLKREILKKMYDPREMISTCTALINLGKRDLDIYHDLAKAYFDVGDYDSALTVVDPIISAMPNDLFALRMKKDIMKIKGQWNDVVYICENILKISRDVDCLIDESIAYEKMNKLESALMALKRATEIAPDNIEAWKRRKDIAKKLNRPDEIIAASLPIIEKVDDLETYIDLGKAYYNIQRFDESKKVLERALKIGESDELWYNLGKAYYKLGELESAATAFKKATEMKGNEKRYWSSLGWIYEKMGRYEEAIDAFNRALDLDSGDMRIWYERGLCEEKIGENEKALKSFDVALKINPKFTKALFEKAKLLFELGNLEDSLEAFNHLIHLEPANHIALYMRGLVNFKLKNYESCLRDIDNALKYEKNEKYYELRKDCCKSMKNWECVVNSARRIVEINRKNLSAYRDLANAYLKLGKVESAIEAYRDALEVFPDNDTLLYELKDILKREERYAEMIDVAKKILELHPDDFNNLLDIAQAHIALGNFENAEDYLLRALEIKKTKTLLVMLGDLYFKMKRYDTASTYYGDALKMEDDPEVRYSLAKCLYRLNNLNQALKEIRKAIRKRRDARFYLLASKIALDMDNIKYALKYGRDALKLKDSPDTRLLLSQILMKAGEYEEVVHVLKDLAKEGNVEALELLAEALEKIGRDEEAVAIYERVLEVDENNIGALQGLGRIHMKRENYEEAKNVYERMVKIMPEDREINEKLAFIYEKLGDYSKALKYINQAIILDPENKFLYNSKGLILMKMELYDDAKKAFEKALTIDPEFQAAREGLKDCELRIEERDIEKYAREVLLQEYRMGRKLTRKEAFQNLGIPLTYVPKVFDYIESDEPFDPGRLEADRKKKFERFSLTLARKMNKIEGLTLSEIVANTNLNVRSAKRLLKYIEFCLHDEGSFKPTAEEEHLVRRFLQLNTTNRSVLNIMLNLDIGVCKAKKIQRLISEYFGEEEKVEESVEVGPEEEVEDEELKEKEKITQVRGSEKGEDTTKPDEEDLFL